MTSLLVIAGPPGAGKSTVAARVARRFPLAVHLHTDDFWHAIASGAIPPYEPESAAQNETVMAVIGAAAHRYAAGGFTTVVDGIVGPWMLPHLRQGAAAPVHYVVLRPARAVALARAQARTAPEALVDAGPVTSMWDQFADLGELERHVLDTSDEPVDATVERVLAAVASGAFVVGPGR